MVAVIPTFNLQISLDLKPFWYKFKPYQVIHAASRL
jgi:hypothetical protein